MTKIEARKAVRDLTNAGWREPEIIKYAHSWRVYVTDNASGYRTHFDTMEAVQDSITSANFYRA